MRWLRSGEVARRRRVFGPDDFRRRRAGWDGQAGDRSATGALSTSGLRGASSMIDKDSHPSAFFFDVAARGLAIAAPPAAHLGAGPPVWTTSLRQQAMEAARCPHRSPRLGVPGLGFNKPHTQRLCEQPGRAGQGAGIGVGNERTDRGGADRSLSTPGPQPPSSLGGPPAVARRRAPHRGSEIARSPEPCEPLAESAGRRAGQVAPDR